MPNSCNKEIYLKKLRVFYLVIILLALTGSSFVFHVKFFSLQLTMTGGTFIIPFAFFFQDIITEVYGYSKSRILVNKSIKILLVYLLILETIKYSVIFGYDPKNHLIYYATLTSRHVMAFIGAIYTGLFINNMLLSKSKIFFKGKYLGFRFIASTMIGELVFMSFGLIVWFGYLNMLTQTIPLIIFSYIFRIAFEAATTPINYIVCQYLKTIENVDVYDFDVSYNPFSRNSIKN